MKNALATSGAGRFLRAVFMLATLAVGAIAFPALAAAHDDDTNDSRSADSSWMAAASAGADEAEAQSNTGESEEEGDASEDSTDDASADDASDEATDESDDADGDVSTTSQGGVGVMDFDDDRDEDVRPNAQVVVIEGFGHDDDDGAEDDGADTPDDGEDTDIPDDGEPEDGEDDQTPPESDDSLIPPQSDDSQTAHESDDSATPPESDDSEVPPESEDSTGETIDVESITSFLTEGQSLADYAELYGLNVNQLVDALLVEFEGQLSTAVENGALTQEQADELLVAAEEHLAALVSAGEPGDDGTDDDGRDGDQDGGEGEGEFDIEPWISLEAVAGLTGVHPLQIESGLRHGQTLAEIAAGYGVTEDALVEALAADAEAQINAAVTAGELTQEEADAILAELDAHVAEFVSGGAADSDDAEAGDIEGGETEGDFNFADMQGALDAIAALTGTTAEEVEAAVMSGQTLLDFAAAHGVSEVDLVATITTEVETQLTTAVESGFLTQEDADMILANLGSIVDSIVNSAELGDIIGTSFDDSASPDDGTLPDDGASEEDGCAPLPPAGAMSLDQAVVPSEICPATS